MVRLFLVVMIECRIRLRVLDQFLILLDNFRRGRHAPKELFVSLYAAILVAHFEVTPFEFRQMLFSLDSTLSVGGLDEICIF